MNKITAKPARIQTAHPPKSKYQPKTHSHNPYQDKIALIQSLTVVHPLIDRLLEVKMSKCFQHGQNYSSTHNNFARCSTNMSSFKSCRKQVEAPTISGSCKKIERRAPASRLRIDFTGVRKKADFWRPKTTNTIIRSRTSEPRITRKLQLISKQQVLDEEEDLKPSFPMNRIRKNVNSASNLIE